MENLYNPPLSTADQDCKLWTQGNIYGIDYSQTLSNSTFTEMDPNFLGPDSSAPSSIEVCDLPPPPPDFFSDKHITAPEHMTVVYPPPREYSCGTTFSCSQPMTAGASAPDHNMIRSSDGLSQYLGAKRKPKYLDLDQIQVEPLDASQALDASPDCLLYKTRKLDIGDLTDAQNAVDDSFDFPENNDDDLTLQQRSPKSSASQLNIVDIVQEGWLLKRGEHIKNWRQRYFMLRMNGDLLGFKMKPMTKEEFEVPLNKFSVKGCQVLPTEEPRPSCLIVRLCQVGPGPDKDKERLFCFLDSTCRDEWNKKIIMVRNKLDRDANQKKISLDDFEITKVLGRGAFGKVVLCREKCSRTIYAMKMLKKTVLLEKHEVEHTRTENRVLQSLRHPFLVNLKYTFTTPERIFFVMEYVGGGELFEHLGRMEQFPESWVRFYGGEVTLGLAYLHSRGIIYRDLKLENLILDGQGHVKIVDFGLCKDKIFGGMLARTMCGTPAYMAPEVFVNRLYGREVDWWSLGVVLYEMATGELPFYSQRREELFRLISKESLRFPREVELSFQLKSLIHRMLEKNPKKRLGAGPEDGKEIMEDNFFASLDWNLLEKRKLTPPFKPQVKHELDTPYVAAEFQNVSPTLTPTNFSTSSSCSFSDFSFKKSSWSHHSTSSRDMEVAI